MSRAFDPFTQVQAQPDPFAPPPAVVTLDLDDPGIASRPTPSDHWIELCVRWGASTLVTSLCAPTTEIVLVPQGDAPIDVQASKDGARLDVPLPLELIGREPIPLTRGRVGHTTVLVPLNATGTYREHREKRAATESLATLLARSTPSRDMPAAVELPLLAGSTFELEAFGLTIEVSLVRREKAIGKGIKLDQAYVSYLALSMATFGGLLAGLAYFTPPLGLEDDSAIDKDRLVLVQHYLSALAQREEEAKKEESPEPAAAPGGEAAAPAPGKPGEAGKPEAAREPAKMAVKGPKDQPYVELNREELRRMASDFGLIGMLRTDAAQNPDAPFSPFARDVAIGQDDLNARGNMWGMDIGEAAGQNGLHLYNNGIGGLDGPSTGVGIEGISSTLGTFGQCTPGAGKVCTFGNSVGRPGGTHQGKAPRIRTAAPSVSGRIPPEVIQRTVRQNFGRFRFCYEQGLAQNPSLEGRVGVRFVIDRTGGVSTASPEPGGMPDSTVARCVAQAFYGLSFPPPDGGIVTVSYPIMFTPG
jgi:hypothetical protein